MSTIRKDGKQARASHGVPPTRLREQGYGTPPAPTWHELVDPGPKGDPVKMGRRLESVRHGQILTQLGSGVSRRLRRIQGNRPTLPGRLVLHPGRIDHEISRIKIRAQRDEASMTRETR